MWFANLLKALKGVDPFKLLGAIDELIVLVTTTKAAIDEAGDAGRTITDVEKAKIGDAAIKFAQALD